MPTWAVTKTAQMYATPPYCQRRTRSGCCPRAAIGHVAAPPPRRVMNSPSHNCAPSFNAQKIAQVGR
jgi:hypothetical protein